MGQWWCKGGSRLKRPQSKGLPELLVGGVFLRYDRESLFTVAVGPGWSWAAVSSKVGEEARSLEATV